MSWLDGSRQDPCKDRDTPDSFVPSSSPESVFGMEVSRYPDLSLVKEEVPSPCQSPVLPLLPAPDGKGKRCRSHGAVSPHMLVKAPPLPHRFSNEAAGH